MNPSLSRLLRLCVFAGWMVACSSHGFDLQGHRGARGLAPENTFAAFDRGLAEGVGTLEFDIAVTADGVPVVSHDLRLNPAITRDASGRWLVGPTPAIRSLTAAALETFDVGRLDPSNRYAAEFPRQVPQDGQRIPTLDALLRHVQAGSRTVRLNVEIKSDPREPQLTPPVDEAAALVIGRLRQAGMLERATLQSFDWRVLVAARGLAPELARSCLSTPQSLRDPAWTAGRLLRDFSSPAAMAADAGCGIWSPAFAGLDADQVQDAHRRGMPVIPWTVNRRDDMERLLGLGVDGLITDEPDVAAALLREKGISITPLSAPMTAPPPAPRPRR